MLGDVYTVWLREMKRFVRARSRIITSLALPFFWLIFVGIGFGSTFKLPGMSYIDFITPGILGMIILFTSIFTGVSVIWDRQFGFLKEILVAPVSRTSIVVGKTLGGATIAVINALIMLAIASILGVVPVSAGFVTALLFMVLTSICFVSIGLIIASRMASMEGFQMIISFLIMPVFFLSGALFPIQNTPQWMQAISHVNPLSYGVDGLRHSLIGASLYTPLVDFVVLAAFAVLFIVIGAYLFRKSVL